jgi:ribosomal protein L32
MIPAYIQELDRQRQQWLEASADHHRDGEAKGTVTFSECPLCGHLEWHSTSCSGDGIEVVSDENCPKCREVSTRSPEIFNWVLNVISHTRRGGV